MCSAKHCHKRVHGNGLCVTHYRRAWRESHPLESSYQNLKNNAKRRGKEFTITFEYFCQFAIETKLILNRGRTADAYTVDRIKNEIGYIPGNLQMLTKSQNVVKQRKLEYDYRNKFATVRTLPDGMDGSDTPF